MMGVGIVLLKRDMLRFCWGNIWCIMWGIIFYFNDVRFFRYLSLVCEMSEVYILLKVVLFVLLVFFRFVFFVV